MPPLRDLEDEVTRFLAVGQSEEMTRMRLPDPAAMVLVQFSEFHAGRCAICNENLPWRYLVDDHCHRTGQIRGRLCRPCNTREGRSSTLLFVRYRRIHPAVIVDLHEMYSGYGWEYGWSLRDYDRTAEIRPATPWPVHSPDQPVHAPVGG